MTDYVFWAAVGLICWSLLWAVDVWAARNRWRVEDEEWEKVSR